MYFIPEAVSTEFEPEEDVVPTAILCVGYANDTASPAHTNRRSTEEYVTYR